MEHTLGVDIGTSGCKAVTFDENGRQVGLAYREYSPLLTPDGGAELDSERVIARCAEVIREAAGAAPPGSVRAIGVSSQGEAFTAVGRDGKALCDGMISSDTRSVGLIEPWVARFGAERLYEITGHTAHPMFSLFKLLWLREHRPEVWDQAWKFLCYEDLLALKLGVDPAMGRSLAGRTMLFDVRQHAWSPEILDAVGLGPERLARPLESGTVSGTIPSAIARELGLGDGVSVVTGGHDQPCGALGAGATQPGLAMYATGTVECITPAFAEPVFAEALRTANLCTYDHAAPGLYATVAFSLTGGNILKWFRDEFGAVERAEEARTGVNAYQRLLELAGETPSPLLVLPYFTPTGTPYFDTRATGAILGLKLSTTRGELVRALLEGVAFEMRLNLDILERSGCPITELRAIGGGAKSPVWNRLKADVLGKPLTTLNVTEAGCLGVAMLACAAVTGETVHNLAARWVRPVDVVKPNPDNTAWYAARFKRYRELYPALKGLITD